MVVTFSVAALVLRERVVVLAAAHGSGVETVAEFYPPHARNGKNGMGDHGLHAVPEGFAKAHRKPFHRAFHHGAQGITVCLGGLQGRLPGLRVRKPAHFLQGSLDARKIEHPFGNDARRNYTHGEPAAEMAAATRVIEAGILEVGREVGMAGTRVLPHVGIVLRPGVLVAEYQCERGAGGAAFVHAGKDFRDVGLPAGGGARGAGPAAGQVVAEIGLPERYPRKDAIYSYTHQRSMRLAKNTYLEFIAKCVHNTWFGAGSGPFSGPLPSKSAFFAGSVPYFGPLPSL